MALIRRSLVLAAVVAAAYAGRKTGRGEAWDSRQATVDESKRANANAEALRACMAGRGLDSVGFWRDRP